MCVSRKHVPVEVGLVAAAARGSVEIRADECRRESGGQGGHEDAGECRLAEGAAAPEGAQHLMREEDRTRDALADELEALLDRPHELRSRGSVRGFFNSVCQPPGVHAGLKKRVEGGASEASTKEGGRWCAARAEARPREKRRSRAPLFPTHSARCRLRSLARRAGEASAIEGGCSRTCPLLPPAPRCRLFAHLPAPARSSRPLHVVVCSRTCPRITPLALRCWLLKTTESNAVSTASNVTWSCTVQQTDSTNGVRGATQVEKPRSHRDMKRERGSGNHGRRCDLSSA